MVGDSAARDGLTSRRVELVAFTGCVLRLRHHVPDASKAIESCFVVGLHTSLARLAPCLDGHPVAWDWDAFADAQAQYASAGLAPAPGP